MSLIDVDDIVEGFSDEKIAGAFRRACARVGVDSFEAFDLEDPAHYEAFEDELKMLAATKLQEDLAAKGYLEPDYVDDEGRVVYKRTDKTDGP